MKANVFDLFEEKKFLELSNKMKYFSFNDWSLNHYKSTGSSGWETEGPGFEPQRLLATFDPRLPQKIKKYSQPYSMPLMIHFARRTLKDKKILMESLLGEIKKNSSVRFIYCVSLYSSSLS